MQNQLCRVCEEPAAGFHFGAFTCEGCKSFFGRTSNNQAVISECKNNYRCVVDKKNRTACKACRLRKCLMVGMSKSGSRYGRRSNWFKIHCLMQQSMKGNPGLNGTTPPPQAEPLSPRHNRSSPGTSPSLPIMPTPIMGGLATSSPSSSSLSPASPPRPSWASSMRPGNHPSSVKDLLLDVDIDAYKSLAMNSMINGAHANSRMHQKLPRPRSVSPLPHSISHPMKTLGSSHIPPAQPHSTSLTSSNSPLSFLPPGHPLNNIAISSALSQPKAPDSPPPASSTASPQIYPSPSAAAAASAALSSLYGSAAFPASLSLMSTPGFPGLPFHKQMLLSPLLAQSHLWSQMARQAATNPLLSGLSGLSSPTVSGEARSPPTTMSNMNGCLSPVDKLSSSTGLSPRGAAQASPSSTSSISPRPTLHLPSTGSARNDSDTPSNATLDLMAEHKALMERFASSVNAAAIAQAAQQAAMAQAAAAVAASQEENDRNGAVSPPKSKENGLLKHINQDIQAKKPQTKRPFDQSAPIDLSSNKKDDMDYDSEDEEINISENDDSMQRPAKRARLDTRGLSTDSEKNDINSIKKIMIKSDLNRNNLHLETLDKFDNSEIHVEKDTNEHSLGSENSASEGNDVDVD